MLHATPIWFWLQQQKAEIPRCKKPTVSKAVKPCARPPQNNLICDTSDGGSRGTRDVLVPYCSLVNTDRWRSTETAPRTVGKPRLPAPAKKFHCGINRGCGLLNLSTVHMVEKSLALSDLHRTRFHSHQEEWSHLQLLQRPRQVQQDWTNR